MYERLNPRPGRKKDKLLVALLLAALVLVLSVTPAMGMALNASYRYHRFVQDFSGDLVLARHKGEIRLTENGVTYSISPEAVSNMFLLLTQESFGKPLKRAPEAADSITLFLPDGATLTLWDTPQPPNPNDGNDIPSGVTVRYAPREGKEFIFLQRFIRFESLAVALRAGK